MASRPSEQEEKLIPDKRDLPHKGLYQPLVRSWRLSTEAYLGGTASKVKVGMYLCPKTGVFYGRIPETNDGTLYVGDTLKELREALQDALKAWSDLELEKTESTRIWERCIRIRYSGGGNFVGSAVTAKESPVRSTHSDVPPTNVTPCPRLGLFTYARFERSIQPDRDRYDEREWEEDYKERVRTWEEIPRGGRHRMSLEEHRRHRPVRARHVSWVKPRFYQENPYRVLRYDEMTWESLGELARRFQGIQKALDQILLKSDEEILLASLHHDKLLAMHDG